MARGRMLKKEISESKKLGALDSDSARLLYTWLIPWLDIEGRYTADPDILKGHLFPKVKPMTIEKVAGLLFELADKNLIILYKSDGEQYLQFTKFKELQSLHPEREAKSDIPAPNDKSCELMRTHDLSPQVKLKKVKLKEVKSKCPKPISDIDKTLTQLLITLMGKNYPDSSVLRNLTEKRQLDWMNTCRLLREADNRTPEQIKSVIEFSQSDIFWKDVILSMTNLRKHWDKLWLKVNKGTQNLNEIQDWINE